MSAPGPATNAEPDRNLPIDHDVVVYTAITDGYDTLKEQPIAATREADFVAFLDRPRPSRTWRVAPTHCAFADPSRNAKHHKILPHRYFPTARYSLWLDGSVTILSATSIEQLIARYLADCDLAVFQHPTRTCLYQEASACLTGQLDESDVIWEQICRYTQTGHPADSGLAECSVLLRRHTAAMAAFDEIWWAEIARGSRRDQISFPYAARLAGLSYATFPGSLDDNHLFRRDAHQASANRHPTAASARPGWPQPALASAAPAAAERRSGQSTSRGADVGKRVSVTARKTVAFGPVSPLPSWSWVGYDTARELARYFQVVLYDSWSAPPPCEVLIAVKAPPPEPFIAATLAQGSRLVYCPIDRYRDPAHLASDRDLLRVCDLVLTHSERLVRPLQPYCRTVRLVEHHTRYRLPELAPYRERGFVLWIGGCQYLPYLLDWLRQHPLDQELRILTDVDNRPARLAAQLLAERLSVSLDFAADGRSIAGHAVERWSERRQLELMGACRAALDLKRTGNFNQDHKPPTKAQQFVASGIPFAVNADSAATEYFRRRGFALAAPDDPATWLSREYWQATQDVARLLRERTSLETVARGYRELINSLDQAQPGR
jgi:alkaline ceramidase TOD1/glycosyltransferase MUCI70-like protein